MIQKMSMMCCRACLLLFSWCNIFSTNSGVTSFLTNRGLIGGRSLPTKLSSFQCDRRNILTKGLSGLIATGTTTTAFTSATAKTKDDGIIVASPPPSSSRGRKRQNDELLSLELAITKLRNDEDIFATRLNYPHPGLRQTATPVTSWGDDLEVVVNCLVANMETNATTTVQYGIDARIMVLRGTASPLPGGSPLVLINPNVLSRSSEDKMVAWREHCLVFGSNISWPEGEAPSSSIPGSVLAKVSQQQIIEVDLFRDATVEIAAQDVTGRPIRKVLQGESSRAFQHEYDHLNGLLVIDHTTLDELPPVVAFLEEPYHAVRQRRAYDRSIYQGNGPLYY